MRKVYDFAGCTAKVEPVASGPFMGMYELKSLHTIEEYRRSRSATHVLNWLCSEADGEGVDLHVTAVPVGQSVSAEVLRKFYEKFGFESYPGMGKRGLHSMVRKARVLH